MNVPGFTAEASLSRTMGRYQGNSVFGGSDALQVSPMQEFMAAPMAAQSRSWPLPWEKKVWCCSSFNGRPYCTYYYVPVWYQCEVIYNPYACWVCRPPVFEILGSVAAR